MLCKNCGKDIPENAKFCNYCGATQHRNSPQSNPHISKNSAQPQQCRQQWQGEQPIDEKAFKKYVTPYIARNIFIVMCGLTIMCLFILPPAAVPYAGVAIIFGIAWAAGVRRVSKQISYMQASGAYEEMLREFSVSKDMLDGKVRYSENYIFGKASGSFYRYVDIGWVYRHNVSYVIIPIRSEVMIGDNRGKVEHFCKLKLSGQAGGNEIEKLAALILTRNPEVLLGFDAETEKEYKRRTR